MKHFIMAGVFHLCFLTLIQCKSSTVPIENNYKYFKNDSNLSDSLKCLYRADAAYLAISEMYQDSVLKYEAVIPESLLLKYYHALLAVYNVDLDKAKGVQQIHDFNTVNLKEFIFGVNNSATWFSNWENGNIHTGISELDNLVDSFNIEIKTVSTLHDKFAVVSTEDYVNVHAFPLLFKGITGIRYVEPNGMIGDGSRISAQNSSGSVILTYSIGWGDCPAGCIYRHYWEFKITENIVTFIKESGDPLP